MEMKHNSKYMDYFYEPYRMTDEEGYQNHRIGKMLTGCRKPPDEHIVEKLNIESKINERKRNHGK